MRNIVSKHYPQLLLAILAFSFFTRLYRLNIPEKYMFDEVYHAVTAKLIAQNDIRAYEWTNPPPEPNTAVDWLHPPLAKYTQAISIKLFGETSFGWRFSSAIFGVLVIFFTARLAFNLFHDERLSLLAALIVSLDGLVLTMSRIAMNDIHVTVFILMALNFYTIYVNSKREKKKFLVLASLSSGLAMGTKWSGVFALLIIGFFEGINLIKIFFGSINAAKKILLLIGVLLVLPISIYILSYSHMFLLGKDFNYLIEMHKNIWWYQTTLDATHPAQSRPINWFLNTKPVWLDVTWGNGTSPTKTRGDIYAVGNPLIFWVGDIFIFISIAQLIYLLKKLIRARTSSKADNKIAITENKKLKKELGRLSCLLFSYFAVWLPWQLSPRIMFFYHYLPAVPLLSINIAFWLNKLFSGKNRSRNLAGIILASFVIAFIVWYPHWVEIEMPVTLKDNLYFAIESWRQQ
ncbi:phospholipid carrier-dependent glycosyltransferase [Patescibacteria group bacterium]|nr:phospholipid carrier-dependent glycosyltransferase [Patescibacteria group bacterium]